VVRLNCGYTDSVNMSLASLCSRSNFNVKIDDLVFAENVFRRVDGGAERAV